MHDPMVVAHEIPSPIPHRQKWSEKHYDGGRWGFTRRRRTNAENLGEPVYRWWRPRGWTFALGGRVYALGILATIWHIEPGGRDSGDVCKHSKKDRAGNWQADRSWKWHVHHWHIQIPWLQAWRRRLFDRCAECGRKGSPNVSFQWDSPGIGWRKWRSMPGLYHGQCASLISLQRSKADDEDLIRSIVAALRVEWDLSEEEVVNRLGDAWNKRPGKFTDGFRLTSRLAHIHGMKMRQRDARWVHPDGQIEELI